MTKNPKPQQAERRVGQDRSLDEAVARALRDNLAPLQRTLEELQHAYAEDVYKRQAHIVTPRFKRMGDT